MYVIKFNRYHNANFLMMFNLKAIYNDREKKGKDPLMGAIEINILLEL